MLAGLQAVVPGSAVAGCARAGAGWLRRVTALDAPTGYRLDLTHELVAAKQRETGITATISCVRCRGTAAGNHIVREVAAGGRPVRPVRPVRLVWGRAGCCRQPHQRVPARGTPKLRNRRAPRPQKSCTLSSANRYIPTRQEQPPAHATRAKRPEQASRPGCRPRTTRKELQTPI
jgi:hypothetical protein